MVPFCRWMVRLFHSMDPGLASNNEKMHMAGIVDLAILRSCDLAILRSCDFAILRSCDLAILRFCDFAILRSCDLAILRSFRVHEEAVADVVQSSSVQGHCVYAF